MIRFILLLLLTTPAAAQDAIVFDPAPILACMTEGEGEAPACIGAASGLCMEATEGGYTTAGMADCTYAETAEWDRLLNAEYAALRATMEEGDIAYPDSVDLSDALRDAQRAWIAYRDAECSLQQFLSRGGTIGILSGGSCRLSFTARRTIEFHRMRTEEGF